jgi:hypothetical protein
VKKLEKEIPSGHKLHVDQEAPQGRAEKMMCANDEMLMRVDDLNHVIDTSNTAVISEIRQLTRVAREKEAHSVTFIEHLSHYKSLVNSHAELLKRSRQNTKVTQLLLHLATSMGGAVLNNLGVASPVGDLLASQIHAIAKVMQEEDEAAAAELAAAQREALLLEEAEANEPLTPADLQLRLLGKKKKKGHARGTSLARGSGGSSALFQVKGHLASGTGDRKLAVIQESVHTPGRPPLFFNRPRIEVLHGLGTAAELGGFIVGVDRPFRQCYSNFFRQFLVESTQDLTGYVQGFTGWFFEQLGLLNRLAGAILVREKEHICVQTDAIPRADSEGQTGEIGDAKKKKK